RLVRAPHAEIDQLPAPRGADAASRLAGNGRVEVHDVDQAALEQLRFENGGGHTHDRLLGKKWSSFTEGMYRSGEMHAAEVVEEVTAEQTDTREECQIMRCEPHVLDILERLLEPRGEQETPRLG